MSFNPLLLTKGSVKLEEELTNTIDISVYQVSEAILAKVEQFLNDVMTGRKFLPETT